jgi:hypothetical protein
MPTLTCPVNSLVQTDMGNMGARAFGMEKAPLTLEDSSKNTAHIVSLRSFPTTVSVTNAGRGR